MGPSAIRGLNVWQVPLPLSHLALEDEGRRKELISRAENAPSPPPPFSVSLSFLRTPSHLCTPVSFSCLTSGIALPPVPSTGEPQRVTSPT